MPFTGEFVRTETQDGLELNGLKSETDSDVVVLHLHGMQGNLFQNGFVQKMLEFYPKNDYSFLTAELRGAEAVRFFPKGDEIARIGNAYEQFSDSLKDIQAWIKYLKRQGYSKIVLQAHSLGAVKTANYLATQSHDVEAAVLISPPDMYDIFSSAEDYDEILSASKDALEACEMDRIVSEDLNRWAYLSAGAFVDLCTKGCDADLFSFYNGELGRWEEIQIPVLATMGSDDSAVLQSEQQCLNELGDIYSGEKFESELFEGCQHDYSGYEEQLASRVLRFLESLQ